MSSTNENVTVDLIGEFLEDEGFLLADIIPPDVLSVVTELYQGVLYIEDYSFFDGENYVTSGTFAWEGERSLSLPGFDKFSILFNPRETGWTELNVEFVIGPDASISLLDWAVALRISRALLKPVQAPPSRQIAEGKVEIALTGNFSFERVDGEWQFDADVAEEIDFPRSQIGDTGVVISVRGIQTSFTGERKGLRFEAAVLELPSDIEGLPDLTIEEGFISSAGFTGSMSAEWVVATSSQGGQDHIDEDGTEVVASIFGSDFKLAVEAVSISFEDNRLTDFSIRGVFQFLDGALDGVAAAEIGLTEDGEILVGLYGWDDSPLITLTKKDLFALYAHSVEFLRTTEELALTVGGEFQLTNPSVKEIIPKFEIKNFTIYKPVGVGGGWDFRFGGLSVEINKSIDLFGVARADIKEIGMGKQDVGAESWNVFTFSGGVHLFDGIDAGAWVEGLRIPWKEDNSRTPPIRVNNLTLDGIGLEAVIPDSFALVGEVVRKREGEIDFFQGEIGLYLFPVNLEFGAALKIGRNPQCRFSFLSAYLNLPGPGIPLGSLPFYLRGMKGLIGVNVTPDADTIYEYYPLATRAPIGLETPSKWRDQCGSHAIGVGAQVATANPKLFNMAALLAFVYPDLLFIIEGSAFVLENPKPGKQPPFRSLMALDIDAPTALINVGAKYEFIKGVITVDGLVEAYYGPDPNNPEKTTGYFALGLPDRRVTAEVLKLFQAQAYMVIDDKQWAMGIDIGLPRKRIGFSFASVRFEAWMSGDAVLAWAPVQVSGRLRLSGRVAFRIFRKGFDLSLGASVVAMSPDWLVDALLWFGVKFKILWKKFKFGGEIPFHWERRLIPPVPELLNEIQLKHAVSDQTTSPLFMEGDVDSPPNPSAVPEVDPDYHPAIAFNFPIKDTTGLPFGQDVTVVPTRTSGDHTFEAKLEGDGKIGIEMYRRPIGSSTQPWQAFQFDPNQMQALQSSNLDTPFIYGAWQADKAPDGTEGATHLHLFVRTPFDYNRLIRLRWSHTETIYDGFLAGFGGHKLGGPLSPNLHGQTVEKAISAAAKSMLRNDGLRVSGTDIGGTSDLNIAATAVVDVPILDDELQDLHTMKNRNKSVPLRVGQYVVHEDGSYPHNGVSFDTAGQTFAEEIQSDLHCHNFLNTYEGFRPPRDLIAIDAQDSVSLNRSIFDGAEVLIGGYAVFRKPGSNRPARLGNLEVVKEDLMPYPLKYLECHCDQGIDLRTRKLVTGYAFRGGILKILLRQPVSRLTIHYELSGNEQMVSLSPEFCLGEKSVSGIVVDCAGKPVAGALVKEKGGQSKVNTDSKGRFCIATRRKKAVTLVVTSNGYGSSEKTVEVGTKETIIRLNAQGSTEVKDLFELKGAYRKKFLRRTFWSNGERVQPQPRIDTSTADEYAVINSADADAFNEIVFKVNASIRIYSICYKIDRNDELRDKDKQVEDFITFTWPGRSGGEGPGGNGDGTDTPPSLGPGKEWKLGPYSTKDFPYFTPEGCIQPGYDYKLYVRTNHRRARLNPSQPDYRAYTTFFSVPRPPENLSPYVQRAFPTAAGFPHYRAHPLFLKMKYNYVHKLMGNQNDKISFEIRRDGMALEPLHFQDAQHGDLEQFLINTNEDRKGWGWGKVGDGHTLYREERWWMETYNRSVPQNRKVQPHMAIPDDAIWVYPVNPVLLRIDFSRPKDNNGLIPALIGASFGEPIDEAGFSAAERWQVSNAAHLTHKPVLETESATEDENSHSGSFLLATGAIQQPYQLSVWLRPDSTQRENRRSQVGIVVAAGGGEEEHLTRYILVRIDLARKRIMLFQNQGAGDGGVVLKIDKRLALPGARWSRLFVRVANVDNKFALTVHLADEQIFSTITDLPFKPGQVGLYASADYSGSFDNFELIALSRLQQLPTVDSSHQLVMKFSDATHQFDMFKQAFRSSRFLDLFDHFNAWDRAVWRVPGDAGNPLLESNNWRERNERFLQALAELVQFENRYADGNSTLDENDAARRALREARFDLDEAFQKVSDKLAFELSPRPQRFEFLLASNGKGLLIEAPEPIDWTRTGAGPIHSTVNAEGDGNDQSAITTQILYTSDFTRAILLLRPNENAIDMFEPGKTYLWQIHQYLKISNHLKWLRGWLEHFLKTYTLTLEIPE